jgi:hypothetical protein
VITGTYDVSILGGETTEDLGRLTHEQRDVAQGISDSELLQLASVSLDVHVGLGPSSETRPLGKVKLLGEAHDPGTDRGSRSRWCMP